MRGDQGTIPGLLAGDPEAVERIRSWIRSAFHSYRRSLGTELEDLEQEILLDLTRALRAKRFQARSSFQTYVRAHVHHKCIDRLRARGRRDWLDVDDLELPSRAPSPAEELSSAQTTELALRVFEEMPESCRELWRMLEEGMRYREMSRRLGIKEGALRARVLRCRRRALEMRDRLLAAPRDPRAPG